MSFRLDLASDFATSYDYNDWPYLTSPEPDPDLSGTISTMPRLGNNRNEMERYVFGGLGAIARADSDIGQSHAAAPDVTPPLHPGLRLRTQPKDLSLRPTTYELIPTPTTRTFILGRSGTRANVAPDAESSRRGMSVPLEEGEDGVYLTSMVVSKRHAKIEFRGDSVYITDLASSLGTYIIREGWSDVPLTPYIPIGLRDGDEIRLAVRIQDAPSVALEVEFLPFTNINRNTNKLVDADVTREKRMERMPEEKRDDVSGVTTPSAPIRRRNTYGLSDSDLELSPDSSPAPLPQARAMRMQDILCTPSPPQSRSRSRSHSPSPQLGFSFPSVSFTLPLPVPAEHAFELQRYSPSPAWQPPSPQHSDNEDGPLPPILPSIVVPLVDYQDSQQSQQVLGPSSSSFYAHGQPVPWLAPEHSATPYYTPPSPPSPPSPLLRAADPRAPIPAPASSPSPSPAPATYEQLHRTLTAKLDVLERVVSQSQPATPRAEQVVLVPATIEEEDENGEQDMVVDDGEEDFKTPAPAEEEGGQVQMQNVQLNNLADNVNHLETDLHRTTAAIDERLADLSAKVDALSAGNPQPQPEPHPGAMVVDAERNAVQERWDEVKAFVEELRRDAENLRESTERVVREELEKLRGEMMDMRRQSISASKRKRDDTPSEEDTHAQSPLPLSPAVQTPSAIEWGAPGPSSRPIAPARARRSSAMDVDVELPNNQTDSGNAAPAVAERPNKRRRASLLTSAPTVAFVAGSVATWLALSCDLGI